MMYSRVTNLTDAQVELKVMGETMFLPARKSVYNVDVTNMDELRGMVGYQIKEEPIPMELPKVMEVKEKSTAPLPESVEDQGRGGVMNLSEVARPSRTKRVTEKNKSGRLDERTP